eukprot:5459353-Ditylum_brightwellii.AAC.1
MPNVIRKKGHGAVFKCVISQSAFHLIGYCFIDNSTISQKAPKPDTPMDELVQIAQSEIYLYAGLVQATGGQVSPVKGENSWYLNEFVWDKSGKWKLSHNKVSLFVNTRKGRIEIERLLSTATSRILGVWMTPNRDSLVQVEKLEALTKSLAD